jgi:hypothetical protein
MRCSLQQAAPAGHDQAGVAGALADAEEIVLSNKISLYSINTQSYYRSMTPSLPSLTESDLNLYGLPYSSQAELVRSWENGKKAKKARKEVAK